jgi:beta-glucanase (GH16 family)
MRGSPSHTPLVYLWLGVLAAAAALLGFPDVAAVARSERPHHVPPHRVAPVANATRTLLAKAPWRLRFDDEFSTGGLDLSKWQPNWLGGSAAQTTPSANALDLNCVSPSQARQAHGALGLAAAVRSCASPGRRYGFASGLVNTAARFHFTYGLLAARIYVPPTRNGTPANFPAFWAVGYGAERHTGELDVMEVLRGCGPGLGWHFHGREGAPGQCVKLQDPSGWHVFAADWEPGAVTFYYDGRRVGEVTQGVTDAPMYLVLNNSVDPTYGGANSAPATMLVDWVRVYQRTHRS